MSDEEELAGSAADEAYVTASDDDEEEDEPGDPIVENPTRQTLTVDSIGVRYMDNSSSIHSSGSDSESIAGDSHAGGENDDDEVDRAVSAAIIDDDPILPNSVSQLSTLKSETLFSMSGGGKEASLRPMESLFSIRTASNTVESRSQAISLTADRIGQDLCVGLFGPNKAGKSSIIQRYIMNTVPSEYEPTIEDHYSRQITFPRYNRVTGQKAMVDSPSSVAGGVETKLIKDRGSTLVESHKSSGVSDTNTVRVNLRLLDTSGSTDHSSLMGSWIRQIGINGVFVFVFSLTSREQFARIEDYMKTILSFDFDKKAMTIGSMSDASTMGAGLPINRGMTISSQVDHTAASNKPFEVVGEKHCLLVGSQCDLEDDRRVTTDEARNLALRFFGNGEFYIECSSVQNMNVNELIELAFKTTQIDYHKSPLQINDKSDPLGVGSGSKSKSSQCCVIL